VKCAAGDLVRNVASKEDGRVIESSEENKVARYMVSVPVDGAPWMFGARVAYWPGSEWESSQNQLLDQEQSA
jgi:hypothetical protein